MYDIINSDLNRWNGVNFPHWFILKDPKKRVRVFRVKSTKMATLNDVFEEVAMSLTPAYMPRLLYEQTKPLYRKHCFFIYLSGGVWQKITTISEITKET